MGWGDDLLNTFSEVGDTVIDPFIGGGPKAQKPITNTGGKLAPPVDTAHPGTAASDANRVLGTYTTGGITTGQDQPQMEGVDMTVMGPGQQNWEDNKGVYNTPGSGEVNNLGLLAQFQDPNNRVQVNNRQNDWFNHFQGHMPDIASDPGLAAWYDNAEKRSTENINRIMAARGAYGSSAANDQVSRGITDLEADKAKNEAQYNLQRLAEQRAWEGLGGNLASGADTQNNTMGDQQRQWVELLSKLGIDAEKLGLDRTNAGQDAANSAENFKNTRFQNYVNNETTSGDRLADIIRRHLGSLLSDDTAIEGDASSGGVAEGNATLTNEGKNAQDTLNLITGGVKGYEDWKDRKDRKAREDGNWT
jgi:hypothetical protein